MARDITAEIERLSEQRQGLWRDGGDTKRTSERLDALYEEKRTGAAAAGSPSKMKKALKRADAEKELDRLMGQTA